MVETHLSNPSRAVAAVIDQIDRYRRVWFLVVGIFLMLSFNGQWQIGPDSAAFRQLGHQLATSGHYVFRDSVPGLSEYHNKQGTSFPGLPLVLAALEKMFGPSTRAPLVLMQGVAIVTLVLVYQLMKLRLPRWAAVSVVVGMGTNPRFLQYTNEILSDTPFLLGVVMVLLAYERVMNSARRLCWGGLLMLFFGLILAAMMRPTYLLLDAAVAAACAWVMLTGRAGVGKNMGDTGVPPVLEASEEKGFSIVEHVVSPIISMGGTPVSQLRGDTGVPPVLEAVDRKGFSIAEPVVSLVISTGGTPVSQLRGDTGVPPVLEASEEKGFSIVEPVVSPIISMGGTPVSQLRGDTGVPPVLEAVDRKGFSIAEPVVSPIISTGETPVSQLRGDTGVPPVLEAVDRKGFSIAEPVVSPIISTGETPVSQLRGDTGVPPVLEASEGNGFSIAANTAAPIITTGETPVSRSRSFLTLVILTASVLLFVFVLDIRTKQGKGVTAGGYESRIAGKIAGNKLLPEIPRNLAEMLENALPISFLGYKPGVELISFGTADAAGKRPFLGFGALFSLVLIAAGIRLARRNVLWGALVAATVLGLGIMGPVPRYFLMILPLLLAAWGTLVHRAASFFNSALVMRLGLGFVLSLNIAASATFILTQHGYALPFNERHRWIGFHRVGFLRAYHYGHWAGIYDLAAMLRKEVRPDEKVIGPEPTILTYLSGRQIYPPHKELMKAGAGSIFHRALFPVGRNRQSFDEYDEPLAALVQSGAIREGDVDAGPLAGYRLSKMEVPSEGSR